ncbi:MAG TPA: ectoine/hydroxyectoine ABC transporter substrate-binding protein EhuB [Burkholderiales bacterium]|nr:ectoine/hydroxyectoine ABC transporter substrate-binding protein EhuB [Burkholderiales bacterium]
MRTLIRVLVAALLLGATVAANADPTLDRIKKEGVVRIGFANEAPWSYAQSDGTIAGADYELAALIFSRLGVPNLEGVLTKFGSLIPGLKANRYDLVVAGFYIRPARCEQVAFSEPTVAVGDAIVVKAGNPKKIHSYKNVIADPTIKLGGVVGAATAQNAKNAGIPDSQLIMFPDFVSAISALKAGRVDGALQTAITAQTTIKSSNDPSIERALPFEQAVINGKPVINYAGFAFRPEDKDLLNAFNAELAKVIGSPEHLKILEKYGISANEVPKGMTTKTLCTP